MFIIPMAGLSSRFFKAGFIEKKQSINNEKPLPTLKVLKDIFVQIYSYLLFVMKRRFWTLLIIAVKI